MTPLVLSGLLWVAFTVYWSAAVSTNVDHRLVRSGPYRMIRHPIYSAMLGTFLGTSIISGEWHALIALVTMSLAYRRRIRLEEQRLRDVFGAEYVTSQKESWAIIPGVL